TESLVRFSVTEGAKWPRATPPTIARKIQNVRYRSRNDKRPDALGWHVAGDSLIVPPTPSRRFHAGPAPSRSASSGQCHRGARSISPIQTPRRRKSWDQGKASTHEG